MDQAQAGAIAKTMLDPNNYSSPMELVDDSAPPADPKPVEAAPSDPPADPAPKKEEAPVDPNPVDPPVDPAPETLYETPDGRKINAEALQKEWKENFLPEFTRKSQRLAELETNKGPDNKGAPEEPKWKKADYVPENIAEVIELAKAEAINEIRGQAEAEQSRVKAIHDGVESQLNEVRKIDLKLDENALFLHATKYGFSDLKAAHSNMMEMKRIAVDAEQRTIKNLKLRDADPIAGGSDGAVSPDDAYDPAAMGQFQSAQDFLAKLKGGK